MPRVEGKNISGDLRPVLDQVKRFVSVERFQRLTDLRGILSSSFLEDEAAIAWRPGLHAHHGAQRRARHGVFVHHNLRIAAVLRDCGMCGRA
jgi:hypothetical protein